MSKINTGVSIPNASILIPMIRNVMPALMAQQIVGVQPMQTKGVSIFDKAIGGHSFNEKYWPHIKTISWNQLFEAERWCYQNFRSRNWRNQGLHFAFKREQDYALFLLRWS